MIMLSSILGVSYDLLALAIAPATENSLSTLQVLAGIARYFLANLASLFYRYLLSEI